jgi:hypothetical protein
MRTSGRTPHKALAGNVLDFFFYRHPSPFPPLNPRRGTSPPPVPPGAGGGRFRFNQWHWLKSVVVAPNPHGGPFEASMRSFCQREPLTSVRAGSKNAVMDIWERRLCPLPKPRSTEEAVLNISET